MRLIDAPIGIFRFDGELVLKTEYYSENKQSGKYIPDCYIVRTGEYFWGDAKTANELINLDVEPVDFAELLPTVTDTISRRAAIDALDCINGVEEVLRSIPSAEPEFIKCDYVKACNEVTMNKTFSAWRYLDMLDVFEEYGYVLVKRRG